MRDIHAPGNGQVKAEIFFGMNKPDGTMVPLNEFNTFLREDISHTFPGFSCTLLQGWWKGQPEVAHCVTILADDSASFRQSIRWIAERYKTQFGQEAVAYAFTAAEFTLDCWPFGPVAAYHRPGLGY